MKNVKNLLKCSVLLLIMVVISCTIIACDGGSVFNGKQAHPDSVVRLEAAGWDLRVYEFTPQTAHNMTCVFVAGNRKAGLDCFPKEK